MPVFESSTVHVPNHLKQFEHWVLWGLDEEGRKRPLAPWQEGHLYPVRWGADAPERPETDWDTAYKHWKNRHTYSAPDGMDIDDIMPAPLLLHDPIDPPLMQVDFDDVRDTETAEVSEEVARLVERLEGYCEISQSGTGLHVFVHAELPGDLGKYIADLADIGEIELYDHGRAVGATWDHVEGTPETVPEAQDTVEAIIQEYEDASQRKRRIGSQRRSNTRSGPVDLDGSHSSDSNDAGNSPYWSVDIRDVADTGVFANYRKEAPGGDWTGPHPAHGPQSSDRDDCTNFGAVPGDDIWYCFLHDSGARAIELAAVLCPDTDIDCRDVPGEGSSVGGWLRNQPMELLRTCLWLRDQGVVSEDARPPYDALLAVADLTEMHIRDETAGILGERNKEIARAIYDELELADCRDGESDG